MSKKGMNVFATEAFVEEKLANVGPGFSGDYKDLKNAPNIQEDDSGEVVYADDKGNVIARVGAAGLETTQVTTKSVVVNGTEIKPYTYGTEDLEAGKSPLPTGELYFVYEEETENE